MALGWRHACAILDTGAVKCWGHNLRGQLGDGRRTDRRTPVTVRNLGTTAAAVRAAHHQTCVLTKAGGVKCWGLNSYGQLGDGTLTSRSTPVGVVGLSRGVAALTTGTSHTCAVTAAGAAKCWGANQSGSLGDGTTTSRRTPVAVVGLGSGVAAIAGGWHTCARTTAGAVKCWGPNGDNELGDGTTTDRLTPVAVIGLGSGVTAITTGMAHSCARLQTGALRCWGANWQGQLGDGTRINRSRPVAVVSMSTRVTSISGGQWHTCALQGGTGKCWGSNSTGELGNGRNLNSNVPVTVR